MGVKTHDGNSLVVDVGCFMELFFELSVALPWSDIKVSHCIE